MYFLMKMDFSINFLQPLVLIVGLSVIHGENPWFPLATEKNSNSYFNSEVNPWHNYIDYEEERFRDSQLNVPQLNQRLDYHHTTENPYEKYEVIYSPIRSKMQKFFDEIKLFHSKIFNIRTVSKYYVL